MTFHEFVQFLIRMGFAPLVFRSTTAEAQPSTEPDDPLDAGSAADLLMGSVLGGSYPNAVYFALQNAEYRDKYCGSLAVWVVAQAGDNKARRWRVLCTGVPGVTEGARAKIESDTEHTFEELREGIDRRLQAEGYWPVRLPTGAPLALAVMIEAEKP